MDLAGKGCPGKSAVAQQPGSAATFVCCSVGLVLAGAEGSGLLPVLVCVFLRFLPLPRECLLFCTPLRPLSALTPFARCVVHRCLLFHS